MSEKSEYVAETAATKTQMLQISLLLLNQSFIPFPLPL